MEEHAQAIEGYENMKELDYKLSLERRISEMYTHDSSLFPLSKNTLESIFNISLHGFMRFMPEVISSIKENTGDTLTTSDIIHPEDFRTSQKITNILSRHIDIPEISKHTDSLIENIWDLFYNSLSEFLVELQKHISDQNIQDHLEYAIKHIDTAWKISEPYMQEGFNPKHKHDIKGMQVQKLSELIWKLDEEDIKIFLYKLGKKIRIDGSSDYKRGRNQLASSLYEAAKWLQTIQ